MAGLDPAIHVFLRRCCQDVDARLKAGHDGVRHNVLFHWLLLVRLSGRAQDGSRLRK